MSQAEVNESFMMKDVQCVRLAAGRYEAVVSPQYGASVWRMRDIANNVEVFRYRDDVTAEQIDCAREIWGLPTLYLPNRFDGGLLKTSDAEYHLPVNETALGNFIHGWAHKRAHKVEKCGTDGDTAYAVTSFTHDSTDPMYEYFPLDFKLTYTFELSEEKGLVQTVRLDNLSGRKLPVSVCTHTCINSPLTSDGDEAALKLRVPISERCELDERCLPTERLLALSDTDTPYKDGSMKPVLHDISNDMYTACSGELDGKEFYGVVITDTDSGIRLCNEVSEEYKFWNMWNDRGFNGYFCPEPMTAMINCSNLKLSPEISGYRELSEGESFECRQRFFTLAAK